MVSFGEPYLGARKCWLSQKSIIQLADERGWVQGCGCCLMVPLRCFTVYPKLSSGHQRTDGRFAPPVNESLKVFHNRPLSFSPVPHFPPFTVSFESISFIRKWLHLGYFNFHTHLHWFTKDIVDGKLWWWERGKMQREWYRQLSLLPLAYAREAPDSISAISL